MKPVRITLSRATGFSLQRVSSDLNGLPAVKVDRSTKWGNVWKPGMKRCVGEGEAYEEQTVESAETAVRFFREMLECERRNYPSNDAIRKHLRGKNLACWCKLGEPCHADVLLELANREG